VQRFRWDRLLNTTYLRNAEELLLISGSPPLLRMPDRLRALALPALDQSEVASLTAEMLADRSTPSEAGYASFEFRYVHDGDRTAWFRATAFGYPNTQLLLVTRILDSTAEGRFPPEEGQEL